MRATWFCEYDSNLYGEMGRMVSEFAISCLHPEKSNGGSLEDYIPALFYACALSIIFPNCFSLVVQKTCLSWMFFGIKGGGQKVLRGPYQ